MKSYSQSKDLKSIAAEISRQAAAGEYRRFIGEHKTKTWDNTSGPGRWVDVPIPNIPRVEFTIGTLKLRCDDTPEAIAALVTRYTKGATKTLCTPSLAARLYAERAGYGKDYGALAVVEHETVAA